jgi:HEAT repeat protein
LLNIIYKTFLFSLDRICNKGGVIISIKLFCIFSVLIVVLSLPATAQSQQEDEISSSLVPGEDNWDVRLKSIEDARTLNESAAVNLLIESLKDKNSSIQMKAAEALGNYNNSTRSTEALIQALGDENPLLADQAKLSLMQIGTPAVVPLILALKVENSTIKANAAQVLGRLGDSRAIEPLRRLQMESNDSDVQTKVAYALRKLDWKEQGTS